MDYRALDRMIDTLQTTVENDAPQKGYWKALWSFVGEIKAGFSGVRYPTREEQQAAWQRLDQLVTKARERSEREKQEREERQKAWESKVEQSERARGRLESKLGGTRPVNDLERMIATVVLAPLIVLENMLRAVLGLERLDEIHEDLKHCSAALKESWAFFGENKGDMLPADKHAAYDQLNKAQDRLNDAWGRWKEAKNRFHEERRRQWKERQDYWHERIEANIEKLGVKLDKAENALEQSKAHLAKLESDYESAWSDKFKERCQEWIDEENSRIRDIEESIDRMRGWLDEERTKLR
jgi:hypothetical protein